jgi:hypothetical protein
VTAKSDSAHEAPSNPCGRAYRILNADHHWGQVNCGGSSSELHK